METVVKLVLPVLLLAFYAQCMVSLWRGKNPVRSKIRR
jgi:hypothetical protein